MRAMVSRNRWEDDDRIHAADETGPRMPRVRLQRSKIFNRSVVLIALGRLKADVGAADLEDLQAQSGSENDDHRTGLTAHHPRGIHGLLETGCDRSAPVAQRLSGRS
jgi:hypothetical protein